MQIPKENRDTGKKIILLLTIIAVSFEEEHIETVGYDFEQVVGTTVYSLTDEKNCTRGSSEMISVPHGSVVFSENDGRREMKTCHYQASYTVSYMKKSSVYDDGLYLHEKSKILPTYYLISIEVCRQAWAAKPFTLPGFEKNQFQLKKTDIEEVINSEQELVKNFDYSAKFMKAKGKGIGFSTPIDWTTPTGEVIEASVLINGRLTIGKVFTQKQLGGSSFYKWNDPLGNPTTSDDIETDFEKAFVVYLVTKPRACDLYKLFNINVRSKVIKLVGEKNSMLTGFVSNTKDRKFALEIKNQPVSMCNLTVHSTIMKGVFFSFEDADLPVKEMSNIDEEMLLQSKIDFLHAQGFREMERVWQEINFQRCRIQDVDTRLKLLLISNLDSAIIGDEMVGTHIERAGEVVYLHRCAKMEVTLATLNFCTEEVPVRLGDGEESVIKFMNPISKVFYNNYTLTECNPVYPNLYQLLNGSWVTYGRKTQLARVEPLVFRNSSSRELRPHEFVGLKSNGLFTMEDLVRSNRARSIRHSRTTVTGREVYLGSQGVYSHETLFHLNFPEHQLGFSWRVLPWFQRVKKETLFFGG